MRRKEQGGGDSGEANPVEPKKKDRKNYNRKRTVRLLIIRFLKKKKNVPFPKKNERKTFNRIKKVFFIIIRLFKKQRAFHNFWPMK